MNKIRVLVIDDSKVMQRLITHMLAFDSQLEVIGHADNALTAREMIKNLNPDVLTLDVEMPGVDGLTFLKDLMRLRPMPVVMFSSYSDMGKNVIAQALEMGAADYVVKPTPKQLKDLPVYSQQLIQAIKGAVAEPKNRLAKPSGSKIKPKDVPVEVLSEKIIAIGASTGGIETIELILSGLHDALPGIVIVQHIGKNFSNLFANRINNLCQLQIMQAENEQPVQPGYALIAPSGKHLIIKKVNHQYICELIDTIPVNGHKPSVDVLFNSAANAAASNTTAILLTGMGSDGAQGMQAIKQAGGTTIAQDEQSSLVWGMPGSAVQLNAAQFVYSPTEIINYLNNLPSTYLF